MSERCQAHNRCITLAPDVFGVDEYGNAYVLRAGSLPPELEAAARLAARSCPEEAIELFEGKPRS